MFNKFAPDQLVSVYRTSRTDVWIIGPLFANHAYIHMHHAEGHKHTYEHDSFRMRAENKCIHSLMQRREKLLK